MSVTSAKVKATCCKVYIQNCAQSAKEKENWVSITDISKDCTGYFSINRVPTRKRKKLLKNPRLKKYL